MTSLRFVLFSAMLAGACAPSAPSTDGATVAPAQESALETVANGPVYSPFVVHVDGGEVDVISFKDVGLGLSLTDGALTYEALANALAVELDLHAQLEWAAWSDYEAGAADPDSHTFCGQRHIYVDVWKGEAPPRWGFSLWSGCGEDSQFAWEELTTAAPPSADNVDGVAGVIADRLAEAEATGCYTRSC